MSDAPKKLALLGASVLLTLLVCEGAARLLARPTGGYDNPYVADPRLTYRLKPGHTHVEKIPGGGRAAWTTNSRGFRGPEFGPAPAPGVRRIVIVGDSSAFGYHNDDGETIAALLEAGLRAKGAAVEVLNAAVPGYTSGQALALVESEVAAWRPDAILFLAGWNDEGYANLPSWTPGHTVQLAPRPPAPGGEAGIRGSADRLLRRWSRLYSILRSRRLRRPAAPGEGDERGTPPDVPAALNGRALADYRENVERLIDLCCERGIGLVLLTRPTAVGERMSGRIEERVQTWMKKYRFTLPLVLESMNAYRRALVDVAAGRRIALLDLAASFEALEDRERHFTDAVHLTATGNEVAAAELERLLAPHLLPGPDGHAPGLEGLIPGAAALPPGSLFRGTDSNPASGSTSW